MTPFYKTAQIFCKVCRQAPVLERGKPSDFTTTALHPETESIPCQFSGRRYRLELETVGGYEIRDEH